MHRGDPAYEPFTRILREHLLENWPLAGTMITCRISSASEGRVLPFVGEHEGEGVALAQENVSRMATMSADEASHWDALHMGYNVDRVNHSEIYSDHGKHTNMVESFFSRLRNMIQGQHHGVSSKYLHQYANHSAWLEDNRRTDNGTLAQIVVSNAMDAPVSRNWKGYWQRAAA